MGMMARDYMARLERRQYSTPEGEAATYASHLMLTLDLIETAYEQGSGIEAVMNVIHSRMIFVKEEKE